MKTKTEAVKRNKTNRIKRNTGEKIIQVLIYLIIILLCLTILLPCINILALAFNEGTDAARGGVYFWPRVFTLENFAEVFKDGSIIGAYKITIARTVLGTLLSLVLMSISAYVLSVKTLPGRNFFTMAIAFTMLFGGGLIPTYVQYNKLGLLNTFWVYIFPGCIGAYYLIMIRTFFESIPEGLTESAQIDGAGFFRIYRSIIIPLSKPIIAVIGLYCAVGHWNDWFAGAFYMNSSKLWPVQTVLQQMLKRAMATENIEDISSVATLIARNTNMVTSDSLKMAAVIITMTPILCVYPFVQKYFTKGVMIGAIKG